MSRIHNTTKSMNTLVKRRVRSGKLDRIERMRGTETVATNKTTNMLAANEIDSFKMEGRRRTRQASRLPHPIKPRLNPLHNTGKSKVPKEEVETQVGTERVMDSPRISELVKMGGSKINQVVTIPRSIKRSKKRWPSKTQFGRTSA